VKMGKKSRQREKFTPKKEVLAGHWRETDKE
jgi:hypothetical protein